MNYLDLGFNEFLRRPVATPQIMSSNDMDAWSSLAEHSVRSNIIRNNAVDSDKIADAAVLSGALADAAVTTAKLANLAVDNTKLAALAVDAAKLASSAVTSTKIANLAVGNAAIALLAVGTTHIANGAITNLKVNDLSAEKITAGILTGREIRTSASGDRFQVYPGGDRIRWLTDSTLRGEIYISGSHLVAYAVNTLNLDAGGDLYFKRGGLSKIMLWEGNKFMPLNKDTIELGFPNYEWKNLYLGGSTTTIRGGAANTGSSGRINFAARDGDEMFRLWTDSATGQANSNEDGGVWGTAGFDYAEKIPLTGKVEAGDVVIVDSDNDFKVKKCAEEYQIVAGVISTRPGFLGGMEWEADEEVEEKRKLCKEYDIRLDEADKIIERQKKEGRKFAEVKNPGNKNATALVGIVPCKVTNKNGAIKRGDRLASSDMAGHAMKATGEPIMGIAMGNFNKVSGKIKILLKV